MKPALPGTPAVPSRSCPPTPHLKRHQSSLIVAGLAAIVLALMAFVLSTPNAGAQSETGGAAKPRMRIGTYDSRAIAVAYARSDMFGGIIGPMHRQRKDAEAAGDQKLMNELDAKGAAMQARLHLQTFSTAPVDEILDQVRDRLAAVAKQKNVVVITRRADYHEALIEAIDITDDLVSLFEPDEKTLKVIADVRRQEPLAIEEVAKMDHKH